MSAGPLVSIVTPSLNQAEYIRAAIESVLAQDYPNIEYIVMDGGSSDATAAVVAEYGSRLSWVSEPDHGQAHAINKGFQRARGEIVAWLNSDDVLLPGSVSAAVAAYAETPAVGAVYGDGYTMDREGRLTGKFPFSEAFNLWRLTWLCDYILQQTCFFRRDALEQVGWLDETLCWALDWDLLVRLGQRFGLRYVPCEMGCLREYGDTKTASGGPRRFRELRQVLRRQTGAWWAPGCWFYGLDTYDKIWSAAIRQAAVGPLRPLLNHVADRVFHLCRYQIDRTARDAQGWYAGGWAGRRLHWMLPLGARRLTVRGSVPQWPRAPRRQRIEVSCGGAWLGVIDVAAGDFEWTAATPRGVAAPLDLEFRAAWALLAPEGAEAPPRVRLAWHVASIEGST